MGLFDLVGKTVKLAVDVVDIAVAPVEIAVDLTAQAIKPVKEVTEEIVDELADD